MAFLEIKKGNATTMAPLDDFAASLGRQADNTVVINDPDVSRRHCIIERHGRGYRIHDLGSRNGTRLNGQPVQREQLKNDDVIKIGNTEIRFVDVNPRSRPLSGLLRRRAAAIFVGAVCLAAIGAFIAWGTGLGGGGLDFNAMQAVRDKIAGTIDAIGRQGMPGQADAAQKPQADRSADGDDGKNTSASLSTATAPSATDTAWLEAYELLTSQTLDVRHRTDLTRPARAVFLGNPLPGDDKRLYWDLPPSGELIALIEPGNAAYEVLSSEPAMLEAECCGVLQRRLGGSGLFLMVGEMRIIGAWVGGDEQLKPQTQAILGQRIVVNPVYTAQKTQAGESKSND